MKEVEPDDKWPDEPNGEPLFSEEEINLINMVTNLRIYDALMALLRATDKHAADTLHDIHERGGLLGAEPKLDPGAFDGSD